MDRGAWRATVRRVAESEMIEEASRRHVPLLVEALSPLPVYPPALHSQPGLPVLYGSFPLDIHLTHFFNNKHQVLEQKAEGLQVLSSGESTAVAGVT